MIAVAGEALIDMIAGPSGSLHAHPGGAPFNVARTIAGLGGACTFLGRFADDAFGLRLRAALTDRGVSLAAPEPSPDPTTLALAELDEHGIARYRFYLRGTSAAELRPADMPADALADADALVIGGLGLVIEPIASTLEHLLAQCPATTTVLVDVNCRPSAIEDTAGYLARLGRVLERCDLIKVSTEDLAFLAPGESRTKSTQALLGRGRAGAVIVTDGGAPVEVVTADGRRSLSVPTVEIVDTVGAGDAFVAGLLMWWCEHSLHREQSSDLNLLASAAAAGIEVSAATCTVAGADLPASFRWDGNTAGAQLAGTPR